MAPLGQGTRLGPLVLEAPIASGGMGAVFRARRDDGAVVAVKLMLAGAAASEVSRRRFEREAELTARLSHPGIVTVHASGVADGQPYLVMDLIDGEPLTTLVGRLAPNEAARLVARVARAVEHAHAHGVLHRDLKPSNVLVRRDDGHPVVTDFGIARALDLASSLTKTGAAVGTPTYMAPEQIAGAEVSAATDVHALGVLLYEVVTGVPPFQQDQLHLLAVALASEHPDPPSKLRPGLPAELDRACLAALEKDPAARPGAGAFAAALEAIADGRRVGPSRSAVARWIAAGVAIAALCALALAWTLHAEVAPPQQVTRPGLDPPTTTALTPPAPAPVDPVWATRLLVAPADLRALEAGATALRTGPGSDLIGPSVRTRLIARLGAFDAEVPPLLTAGPLEVDEDVDTWFRRALWTHALLLRLDPGHGTPPRHGEWLSGTMVLNWERLSRQHGLTFAVALIEVFPDYLDSYENYWAVAASRPPGEVDLALLERGSALAVRLEHPIGWRNMARARAQLLSSRLANTDGALTPLDALVDETEARATWEPKGAAAARGARGELLRQRRKINEALTDLNRSIELEPTPTTLACRCKARVDAFRRTPSFNHFLAARGDLEAALAEVREAGDWHTATAALSLASILDGDALSELADQLERAVTPRPAILLRTATARLVLLARRSGATKEALLPLLDGLLRVAQRRAAAPDAYLRSFAALVAGARADAVTVTELADQLTALLQLPP